METIYLAIVVFLLCLAVFDLFVGVSNDAVNFLNSAIGAKVAKFRTVLIVASAGVAIGAVMSSGMMDVARHGIMQPANFSFYDVMTIFLAVMVTDVIVLDMFNTLGMPTSTTVSLVFELLGGTFVLAAIKIAADPTLGFADLLNTDKALSVIVAIFVSVAIAFFFGMIVQWLSRIVFTFNYKKHSRYSIALFGGIAFTALSYFIFLKGLGKSRFIAEDVRTWIDSNISLLLLYTFIGSTIKLTYEPTKLLDNPKYYSHFTISRIENGTAHLLNFEEGQADMGNGTTWSNTFKKGYKLDAGTYMLTTGTRLASGSVLASNRLFEIVEGQTTTLPLEIRQNTNEVTVIGSFNSESLVTKDGKEVSLLSQTGRGYYVVGILGVGQEPTNHALHDIEKMKEAFEAWGRPVVLLFESEADAAKFNHDEFPGLPSTVQFALDKDGSVRKQIAREMKLMNEKQMPMFIIADTFNRVVFVSQGYTIGLGEQMQGVFKKL